jgi:hypothetical protein
LSGIRTLLISLLILERYLEEVKKIKRQNQTASQIKYFWLETDLLCSACHLQAAE